jgi:hypothetical protein
MTDNRIEVQFAANLAPLSDGLAQAVTMFGDTNAAILTSLQSLGTETTAAITAQTSALGTGLVEQGRQEVAIRQDVYGQLAKLRNDSFARANEMQDEELRRVQQEWQKMLTPITHAFGSSIQGMIQGTQTFRQAMAHVGQAVLGDFISLCERLSTQWLAQELAKLGATEAGAAARTATEQSASLEGLALHAATSIKTILNDAYKAAASTYASVSEIPYVGWILAPPAAAAAFAAVAAFGGSITSAAGGYVVPQDMLAMVHQREVILPAHIADRFINASNPGGNAGPAVHFNVTALDANGVARFFKQNGNAIADSLKGVQRNFKPGFARV